MRAPVKDELGVIFTMKVNLISDKKKQQGSIEMEFGCNNLPTKEQADEQIKVAINEFNKAIGAKDARLTGMRDFGFAEPRDFGWKFKT